MNLKSRSVFEVNLYCLAPEKLGLGKNSYLKVEQNVQLITSILIFFNKFINRQLFSFFLKTEIFSQVFKKKIGKKDFFLLRRKTDISGKRAHLL